MDNITCFLQILKDFIWEKDSIVSGDVDWEEIRKHAQIHQIEAIFYKQTHRNEYKSAFAA